MFNLYLIAPARSGAHAVKLAILLDEKWRDGSQEVAEGSGVGPNVVHFDPQDSFEIQEIVAEDENARFLFISRSFMDVLASSLVAWRSGKFVTNPDLEGWWGEKWSLQLIPNWKTLIGAPLAEVVTSQYVSTMESVMKSLANLPEDRWTGIHFESFIENPQMVLNTALGKLGFPEEIETSKDAQLSDAVLTKPKVNKWHRNYQELMSAVKLFENQFREINRFRSRFGALPVVELPNKNAPIERENKLPSAGTPFASSFTKSLVQLLAGVNSSLLVSTYKSGRLITVRVDGDAINTDWQSLKKPMGIAAAGSRLAVGVRDSIVTFSNQPALSRNMKTIRPATDVFAPRAEVVTGDISIHEMAYGTTEEDKNLYFVNTAFSCLCVMEPDYSWVPVWRPKWITAYSPEDRCHLNGLAMVDGKPKYVSCLAESDAPHGWRESKGESGLIIDVTNDEVVARGLSMPHSPRWYKGELWVLESGKGSLSKINISTGESTVIAELPGFTRGLTFIGKYALIGLSQVRESVFKALPITQSQKERNCGVWVVDTDNGQTVAFLKFEGEVQEIFDVALLPGMAWPEFIDRGEKTEQSFVLPEKIAANFTPARPRLNQ
jgi:uncharacterized protein (TIGR03032 family)